MKIIGFGTISKTFRALGLALAALSVLSIIASAQTPSTEYTFDAGADGWDCSATGGALWPDPVCRSPQITGQYQSVSAIISYYGDTDNGIFTARLVDTIFGVTLCEAHQTFNVAPGSMGLYCGTITTPHKLEIVEGKGDILIEHVRMDAVPITPPTPTPAPTLAPTPYPTPTPIPAWVGAPVYNPYPVGSPVGGFVPYSSPSPTPLPVDCRVYLRIYAGAAQIYESPVDVEFLTDRTSSYQITGFAVLTVPCGRSLVTVRDKSGLLISDPFLADIRNDFSLDLGISLPLPTPIPPQPVSVEEPAPDPNPLAAFGDLNLFNPSSLDGEGLGGLQLSSISTFGVRTPITQSSVITTSTTAPAIPDQPVKKNGFDWVTLLGFLAFAGVLLRAFSFIRR